MFQGSQQIKVVCSCVRTLVHFAGFYRQPLSGLLRGFLCLEVCISRSASGIELKITTFRKSLLYLFVLSFALFSRKTENIFAFWVIGSDRSQSQHIAAQALQKFNMCEFFCELACFYCEGWDCLWTVVSIYRETLSAVVLPANTCMKSSFKWKPLDMFIKV